MSIAGLDIHPGDIVTSAAALGAFIVSLMIKNSQGEMKLSQEKDRAALLAHQTEIKETLVAAQAVEREKLSVHIAEDTQRFENISETLLRIEKKL